MTDPTTPEEHSVSGQPQDWTVLAMAHDVNELLGTILGRAQLLLAKSDSPEVVRQLELIVAATRDAAALVRRILDGEPRIPSASLSPITLAAVVADCLELTRHRWAGEAEASGVTYEIEVAVPPGIAVRADPAGLRQVLTNLLVNALEAMPGGGSMRLVASSCGDETWLEVHDTGCGMDRTTQERLFEPGFTAGKPKGRGLGLTACQRLVQDFGGRIDVTSQVGVGTRFRLSFPRVASDPGSEQASGRPAGQQDPAALEPGTTLKIMVVDNESSVRELLAEVLAADGHAVTLAAAGREALQRFQRDTFDLILADLTMPGMDGLELVRSLRARDPAVAIAVISGWGSETMRAAERGVGVDLTAAKPLDIEELRRLVASATSLVRARRSRAGASHA